MERALGDAPYDLPLQTALGVLSMFEGDSAGSVTQLRFVLDLEASISATKSSDLTTAHGGLMLGFQWY